MMTHAVAGEGAISGVQSQEKQFVAGRKLPPSVEITLRAFMMALWRSISTIPCGVQVGIQVTHSHDKMTELVVTVGFQCLQSAIKLALSFSKMK